jgi:hypothetical protein
MFPVMALLTDYSAWSGLLFGGLVLAAAVGWAWNEDDRRPRRWWRRGEPVGCVAAGWIILLAFGVTAFFDEDGRFQAIPRGLWQGHHPPYRIETDALTIGVGVLLLVLAVGVGDRIGRSYERRMQWRERQREHEALLDAKRR